MAYVPGTDKPILLVPSIGDGPALWYYAHTDLHTDIDAAGYFSDGAKYGLKANDVMIVVDTDASCTIHRVLSATTIAAATLA